MEIIIEIEQFDTGQMAWHAFIESIMVFPLEIIFSLVEMVEKSSKYIKNKCSHWALGLILIGKDARRKGNIKHVRTWLQAISSTFSCLFR